jgi:cobaltochelatase CobT
MGADPVHSVQAQVRRQQRLDALCAATLRALSARREVHARGPHWYAGDSALPSFAPHLHPQAQHKPHASAVQVAYAIPLAFVPPPQDQKVANPQAALRQSLGAANLPDAATIASFRGAADGIALRLSFSDAQLHRQLRPQGPMARRVFDVLEQYRVESLVPPQWPGVRSNMSARFAAWSHAFVAARLHESAQGLLLLTVAQIGRARVTGEPVDEALQDMLEATRFGLVPHIGHALAGLRRSRHDQALYAQHALAIAQVVADLADGASQAAGKADKLAPEDSEEEDAWLQIWVDFEAGEESGFASALEARQSQRGAAHSYRVFSTRYDREVRASDLVRQAQLQELRSQLDLSVRECGVSAPRLARRLQTLLALPQIDGWESAQDSGYIDGRRLAQMVAKPDEQSVFRLPHSAPRADVALTLLLDCSGSMKQHMEKLAPLVDLLTRALDMAGVATEVLGYTTNTWNGGRLMRDWRRSGKPVQPGRLNELCHMVFKDSGQPWRRSKLGLSAMLKADLFRECVDGEALRWAAERLRAQETERRMLVVFSDGSPMDGATVLANDTHYLDRDLQHVARQLEREAAIGLCAVGLGLDLSAYFARSTVLDLQNQTAAQALGDVLALLARTMRQ